MLLLVLALLAGAPAQRPTDIVKWSADAPAAAVRPGGVVKITLKADVEDGWKLYALEQPKGGPIPLAIAVAKNAPFTLSSKQIAGAKAKSQKDEVFSVATQYYENTASFTVPVTVASTLGAGEHVVPIDVTFQACGQSICLRPYTQRLDVKVTVAK